jgi:hypothetical protein
MADGLHSMSVNSFMQEERARAVAWKKVTADLTGPARQAADYYKGNGEVVEGPFDYCLPPAHAVQNLLPDARAAGLETFKRLGISWHAGIRGGPGNHLLDSQVQCVNALAPHARDPGALRWLFGEVLPIAEMLPIELDAYVTFQWIGESDHLDEAQGMSRKRGSRVTSADAAIRYRATDGSVEVSLIEWKYREDYNHPRMTPNGGLTEDRMRHRRSLWDDAVCPLRHEAVTYRQLFVEPRYQLFRLQSLAACMERAGELGAQRVRFVVAASSRNQALAPELARWPELLHRPDRFAVIDTDRLLAPDAPSSAHYRHRYGSMAEGV